MYSIGYRYTLRTLGGKRGRFELSQRCAWIFYFTEGLSEIAHTIYRGVVQKTQIVMCMYGSSVTFTQRYSIYHL